MALPHLASLKNNSTLRVGEIAMSNLNSNHIVKISDVAFDSKAEILYISIPFSKTDQLGHTTTLKLKRSVPKKAIENAQLNKTDS
jgi:hypothetical protein